MSCNCSGDEYYDEVSGHFYSPEEFHADAYPGISGGAVDLIGAIDLVGNEVDLVGAQIGNAVDLVGNAVDLVGNEEAVYNEVGICVGFNCPARGFLKWENAANLAHHGFSGDSIGAYSGNDLWERQREAFQSALFRY